MLGLMYKKIGSLSFKMPETIKFKKDETELNVFD